MKKEIESLKRLALALRVPDEAANTVTFWTWGAVPSREGYVSLAGAMIAQTEELVRALDERPIYRGRAPVTEISWNGDGYGTIRSDTLVDVIRD